ncbi:aldo/keto reductase [Coxiella endosymbiont of Ornithodoros amblus]|uniref:aldo/keto reductase n=1 Tax=Coxiella endosymbiont of Ornithodoros amblus TaxID=1656166 RepID=UPI00244E2274|nr:aldo/keto reductase [Coxiella endosymbiont of Ornithodoros amblus]
MGYKIPENGDAFIPLGKLPITSTWKSMENLVGQGLTKSIGVSNFSISRIEELSKHHLKLQLIRSKVIFFSEK